MLKHNRLALSLGVAALGLAGTASAATIQLTYWNGFTGPDMPFMQNLVKQFNDSHPGITVKSEPIPWGTLFQQLAPSVAAGRGPDVVALNEDVVTGFIERGAVQELTPTMLQSAGIDLNRFYGPLRETGQFEGKTYGVPIHSVALVAYYNRALFKAAGLNADKPPQTWDEFLADMQKLTIDQNGKHPNEAGFDVNHVKQWGTMIPLPWMGSTIGYAMVLQNGGSFVSADRTKATFNSPEAAQAVQRLVDLIYKYHVAPAQINEDDSVAAFRQGKVATCFNGVWRLTDFNNQKGLDFVVQPFPRLGGDKDATWGGSSYLALPKQRKADADRTKAALEFVNWITQAAQDQYWTQAGSLPTQPDVSANLIAQPGNQMANVYADLGGVTPLSGFSWVAQVRGSFDESVSAAMLQKKSVQQALDDGVTEANQKIADAMK